MDRATGRARAGARRHGAGQGRLRLSLAVRSSPAAKPMSHEAAPPPRHRRDHAERTTTTSRAARAGSTSRDLLGIPASDPGPPNDQGLLVHDMLCASTRAARAPTTPHVADVLAGTAPRAITPRAGPSARAALPVASSTRDAHEHELARFHRLPPPMFMATARIDAIWVHDGLLDARDYKTGGSGTTRVADVPAAEVQAFVLARGRGQARPATAAALRVPAARGRRRPGAVGARRRRLARDRGGTARRGRAHVGRGRLARRRRGRRVPHVPRTARSAATARRPASPPGRCSSVHRARLASPAVPIDPRSPVIVGVGQASQRVPAEQAQPPIDLLDDAAAPPKPTRAPRCSRGRHRRGRADRLVALPRSRRAARAASSGSRRARPRCRPSAATARSCSSTSSPSASSAASATSCSSAARSACTRAGAPGANPRRAHVGHRRRRAVRVGDRRRPPGQRATTRWRTSPSRRRWCTRCSRPRCAPKRGRTIDEHQRHVSELWSRSRRSPPTTRTRGRAPRTPPRRSARSRPTTAWSCSRIPKRMCANIDVDQAAALLLCSYEAARAAGVADDRMVFLHAAAEAHDHYFFTERDTLTRSPAIARGAPTRSAPPASALDDVAHFDLYSCFPSAVQVAARRARHRRRRSAPADGHRRARLRGRAGQQLPDARDRADGRGAARRPRRLGLHDRARLVHHQARGRRVVERAARGRFPPRRPGDDASARRCPTRAARPAGLVDGDVTIEATSVAFERDGTPRARHRHAAHRRRPPRARQHVGDVATR